MFRLIVLAALAFGLLACGETPPLDPGLDGEGEPLRVAFDPVALPGLPTDLTTLAFLPGDAGLLVGEKQGGVFHYRLDDEGASLLGQMEIPEVDPFQECGVLDVTPAPDWESTGHIFASHCLDGETSRVVRLTFDGTDYEAAEESLVEIYRVGRTEVDSGRAYQHTLTTVGFEDNGVMYISVGDRRVEDAGQDPNNDLASLLRVLPSRTEGEGGSEPAPDNPFIDGGGSPNVYAKGLRSPWRVVLDRHGRYWVGDVGGSVWEEINVVTAPGQNFGWADHEGPCRGRCDDVVDAVVAYDRSPSHPYILEDPESRLTTFRTVFAGLLYEAPTVDRYRGWLNDRLIFGDATIGWVRVLAVDDELNVLEDRSIGNLVLPTDWAQGPDGYVYVSALADPNVFREPIPGVLYRMVPRDDE